MYRSCAARVAACRNAKKKRAKRKEVFMRDWFLGLSAFLGVTKNKI
jgi:hypothetical protein